MTTGMDDRVGTGDRAWSLRAATWLSGTQFFVFGIAIGVMTVVWAEVIVALTLTEGVFGSAQMLLPVVGLVTLLSAKRLYRHFDHRVLGIAGQAAMIGMLLALAISTSIIGLLVAFVLAGLASALIDTATNSVFIEVEQHGGRDVMNVMYAINSGGTVISALGAGALLSAGMPYRWMVTAAALLIVPVLVASFLIAYPPVDHSGDGEDEEPVNTRTLLRNRLFRIVFVMTILAIAVESIVQVWSVIYVDQLLDVPIVVGGAAFALFSLMMMVGRLVNAAMVAKLGIRRSFLVSAVGTTLSGLALVIAPGVLVSVLAFVMMGIAIAGVQPTCLSASARVSPGNTGIVAAAMMLPAYGAFIAVPTVYGWLAQATSLNIAMIIVVLCGVGVGVLAVDPSVAEADRAAAEPAATEEPAVLPDGPGVVRG